MGVFVELDSTNTPTYTVDHEDSQRPDLGLQLGMLW